MINLRNCRFLCYLCIVLLLREMSWIRTFVCVVRANKIRLRFLLYTYCFVQRVFRFCMAAIWAPCPFLNAYMRSHCIVRNLRAFFNDKWRTNVFQDRCLIRFMRAHFCLFNVVRNFNFLFRFNLFSFLGIYVVRLFRLRPSMVFVLPTLLNLHCRINRLFTCISMLNVGVLMY